MMIDEVVFNVVIKYRNGQVLEVSDDDFVVVNYGSRTYSGVVKGIKKIRHNNGCLLRLWGVNDADSKYMMYELPLWQVDSIFIQCPDDVVTFKSKSAFYYGIKGFTVLRFINGKCVSEKFVAEKSYEKYCGFIGCVPELLPEVDVKS
jgi:hypothetical protein